MNDMSVEERFRIACSTLPDDPSPPTQENIAYAQKHMDEELSMPESSELLLPYESLPVQLQTAFIRECMIRHPDILFDERTGVGILREMAQDLSINQMRQVFKQME